jgi:hypothetical protein
MKKAIVGMAAALAVLSSASLAAAEDRSPAKITKDNEGYGYDFVDPDGLSGLSNNATGGVIRVPHAVMRRTLIRPRTNFVPEMLKSVEHI